MRVCGWGEKREEKKRKKGKRKRQSKWDMCQGVGG
jgi:hypothetical protein